MCTTSKASQNPQTLRKEGREGGRERGKEEGRGEPPPCAVPLSRGAFLSWFLVGTASGAMSCVL